MPRSVSLALVIAILGTILFHFTRAAAVPATRQTYTAVAVALFNTTAIVSLLYILYAAEKETAAKFGAIIRRNLSTIVVALLISLVGSVIEVLDYFGVR